MNARNIFMFFLPLFLLSFVSIVQARVIRVPADWPTIQSGINGSEEGDTVLVAAGIYTGAGNRDIDFLGRSIVVMSEDGADYTIVDCEGTSSDPHRGFIFSGGEGPGAILQGFAIRNGYAVVSLPGPPSGCGAGILCSSKSSPIVRDCIVEDCTAEMFGGGMFIYMESSPGVLNCVFRENRALRGYVIAGYGGGISIYGECSPVISACTFLGNEAVELGGGIAVNHLSSPSVSNCYFTGNRSGRNGGGICSGGNAVGENCRPEITGCELSDNYAERYGGAIGCLFGSAYIGGNIIEDNRAGWGGGVAFYRGNHRMEDTGIEGNSATAGGGGVCVIDNAEVIINGCSIVGNSSLNDGGGIFSYANLSATDCVIAGNSSGFRGGGIYTDKDNHYQNCTIVGNVAAKYGGGVEIQIFTSPSFMNCIIRENEPDEIHLEHGGAPVVVYSNVRGGWEGDGNIDNDPLFVLSEGGDYRLLWGSPCIDSGHPDVTDPDGTRSDIGAFFFDQDDYLTIYLTHDLTEAVQGGHLGVTYTLVNRWEDDEIFEGLATVILPDGTPLEIFGPVGQTIHGNQIIQAGFVHDIPLKAPEGRYEYRAVIGETPQNIYDEDSFRFRVCASKGQHVQPDIHCFGNRIRQEKIALSGAVP